MGKKSRSEAGLLGAMRTKEVWHERYAQNPKFCKHCDGQLPYEKRHNKFCNHSCAASHNNSGVSRNSVAKKECGFCGKETHNNKFCSNICFQEQRWLETVEKIEETGCLISGGKHGVYDYNPVVSKRYLGQKRGRKCEICKGKTWRKQPIPLILDHISGDPADHRLENVRLVCGNCDMQLPTFAGRNRGQGRTWRYT